MVNPKYDRVEAIKLKKILHYRILQIVRGGKVSRMDKVLQICWKTFAVHSPQLKCAHVRRLMRFH